MDEKLFDSMVENARARQSRSARPYYWAGYECGLRRAHYGGSFSSDAEHAKWMAMRVGDKRHTDLGSGYRDGFTGKLFGQGGEADARLLGTSQCSEKAL